ncbi:Helix-turn-helix domain-containing protein [Pseudobutyrivibrio sp. YE44]|uniref:response regulator transcription factor n=1 Tax=Pseudobutyrivibrio sp. YE44 TaxID=1520802 RepID=UPI00088211DF|nr:response regulator [Pseudobutyrivibrio sp. YE44]SDB07957.1 Helix-turn-helix domain-containing protein [Pseudobutyrivibrio sp. YE44]
MGEECMYNVMLVDDEEEVRVAIEKKINWEDIGFKVVGSAGNGFDALDMALECRPDVVMTDINMPFMNGLEFSKQLKAELPATKFVILSGYDEFEYAKEAIELSVEEYILKPVNSDELYQLFSRLKERLDNEVDIRHKLEQLEKYFMENTSNAGDIVDKAKAYILEHYKESDLSVDKICSYLNVTPNYFSTLFRKKTGLTFVTYLTNLRMEKAKWLLDNTDEKAYIIAGMIGIEEPNYFSYVFKKAYGISPSKYRQQRGN